MTDFQYVLRKSDLFRLVAACFYEPDREMFLEENLCPNLASLATEFLPEAVESAEKMGQALANLSQEELSVDHAALFVGPFELLAAPYGSIYQDEAPRQVMTDSTMKVLEFYREAGLEVEAREVPDHIAIELEFLSYLAGKEAEALEEGNTTERWKYLEKQREFFTTSMTWLPRFCGAIRKGAATVFYLELATCLEALSRQMDQILSQAE